MAFGKGGPPSCGWHSRRVSILTSSRKLSLVFLTPPSLWSSLTHVLVHPLFGSCGESAFYFSEHFVDAQEPQEASRAALQL